DDNEDIYTDNEGEPDNSTEEQVTQTTNYKPRNGQRKVDMTPPEDNLKRSEKLAQQYSLKNKVSDS
ncbi:tetratricopeptide repeat protein 23, partial [Biomphalaria glabrata]